MNPEMLGQIPTNTLISIRDEISSEILKRIKNSKLSNRIDNLKVIDPDSYDDSKSFNKSIHDHNSSGLYSLRAVQQKYSTRMQYLPSLIDQDWAQLFPRSSEYGDFYVYVHIEPGKRAFSLSEKYGGVFLGRPFYVGKGSGDRAYNLKRNQGHGKKLKKVLSDGWKPEQIVHVAFDGLSENRALEIESKLIYFFGGIYDRGEKSGILFNLDIPKIPDFIGEMQKFKNKHNFKYLEDKEIS